MYKESVLEQPKIISLVGDILHFLGKTITDFDAQIINSLLIFGQFSEASVNHFFIQYYCYDIH
jgi:hypothetical protein